LYSGNIKFPENFDDDTVNYYFAKPINLKQLLNIINNIREEK
jgi:hypothetical protein